jgi:ribosomal protein S18 acetylase RimI-like enzyme
VQNVYSWYHNPDYFTPEPYADYPSHLHIDLLPRAQGHGNGRRMLEHVMKILQKRGSPGAHLGVSEVNARAFRFYKRLGFQELIRVGDGKDRVIYMCKKF